LLKQKEWHIHLGTRQKVNGEKKTMLCKNLRIGKNYSKKMATCDVIPSKISIVWPSCVEWTNKHLEPLIKHMASYFIYDSGWW
jgi:hypothetical protein